MIILRFTSGLGNQMFQYSMYRYLVKHFGRDRVRADVTWFSWNEAHQGFELTRLFERADNPGFFLDRASVLQVFCHSGALPQKNGLSRVVNRIVRGCAHGRFEKMLISETGREKEEEIPPVMRRLGELKDGDSAYITGYFLNESYYKDNLSELRESLKFDPRSLNAESRALYERLSGEESVAIHVRRGDYLNPGYTENFINLGTEYYKRAVEKAGEVLKDPKYYLFSDDPLYLESAFDWLPNRTIVDWNRGEDSFMDLCLMSRCRCCITANSTFSEWAGLLNVHNNGLIIYPREYMKDKDSDIKTIPGWVRI